MAQPPSKSVSCEALKADFPDKLQCLFDPARYKILYGGRGGSKSWGIARALLILGVERKLRIACGREIQKSISDSVHHLLKSQIEQLGLDNRYRVYADHIDGTNGTLITFHGLKANIESVKSIEGIDIFWAEEAQTLSKASWDILVPTIRKDGSEIWVSFNPELETDETYRRFVLSPPKGAIVRKIGWRDNPWFNQVLRDAKALLDDSFTIEPDLPEDLKELVRKLDARSERPGGAHRRPRAGGGRRDRAHPQASVAGD